MDWNKVQKITYNIFGHSIIHLLVLFCTVWICGALVALVTGQISISISTDFTAINIAFKWAIWLINSWSHLTFETYNYLKVKLLLSFFTPPIIVIIFYIKHFRKIKSLQFFSQPEKVYGDARWANNEDVERTGLRSKHDMLLGIDSGGYFIADGFQHVLLFAPTGSGKGVGFVIPNLLFW